MVIALLARAVLLDANAVFESLFFETGAWLGLALFLIIMILLVKLWKYAGVFAIMISIFMMWEYWDRMVDGDHSWKIIILVFFTFFLLYYWIDELKK